MLILFSLMACTEPSVKRIDKMTKRLEQVEKKHKKTEEAFDNLVEDCVRLDEILRSENTPKQEMQLLLAYLQQYEDERDAIEEEIEYSYSQLKNLREDFAEGLYDETQREEYLTSEEKAINTIDAKLDYFLDRFEKQSDFVRNIEKQ